MTEQKSVTTAPPDAALRAFQAAQEVGAARPAPRGGEAGQHLRNRDARAACWGGFRVAFPLLTRSTSRRYATALVASWLMTEQMK